MKLPVELVQVEIERFKQGIIDMAQMVDKDVGKSNYKVLLLLMIFSRIDNGDKDNVYYYSDTRDDLTQLMKKYRMKEYESDVRPDQPFVRMANSSFWFLHPEPKADDFKKDGSLPSKALNSDRFYGYLSPHLHSIFVNYPFPRKLLLNWLVNRFYGKEKNKDLQNDLKIGI